MNAENYNECKRLYRDLLSLGLVVEFHAPGDAGLHYVTFCTDSFYETSWAMPNDGILEGEGDDELAANLTRKQYQRLTNILDKYDTSGANPITDMEYFDEWNL